MAEVLPDQIILKTIVIVYWLLTILFPAKEYYEGVPLRSELQKNRVMQDAANRSWARGR